MRRARARYPAAGGVDELRTVRIRRRWVGLGWLVLGLVGYVAYRRRVMDVSAAETFRAPPACGPALALEYRRLLAAIVPGRPSDDAVDVACRFAAERGARGAGSRGSSRPRSTTS